MLAIITITVLTLFPSVLSDLAKCRPSGWNFKPYQEVMFASDIVLYGRDVSRVGECPPHETICSHPHREHSRFRVFCILKSDGQPINQEITIEPEIYWQNCTATRFSNTENEWEYVVAVKRGMLGKFHWDETHAFQAAYHKAHPDIDVVLQQVTRMCGMQEVMYPINQTSTATKSCPVITVTKDNCTHACERDWERSGTQCYLISSITDHQGRNDASLKCAGHYAHLLSITTDAELSFVGTELAKRPETEWWTSGRRVGGEFIWDDKPGGTPFNKNLRSQWRPTQPDNKGGNQDYLSALYTKTRYGWSDNNVSLAAPYVCEKAMTFRKPTAKCGFTTTSEEEISKCLLLLRHALATSTDFWFGDSYKKRCQSNADVLTRKGIHCLRVGKTPASLVERLFGANNLAATSLRQLLHVTITAHPGTITSCDQTFSGMSQTTQLDPIKIPTTTSWYVRKGSTLSIKWTPEDDVLYSLIVVDAGLLSIRGMWVNIQGDDWDNGKVLKNYSGSASPFVHVSNPVVFLLYKQESSVSDVSDKVEDMLEYDLNNNGEFSVDDLGRELNLTGPIAMNMMLVQSDAYSAAYDFKPKKPTNLCHIQTQKAARALGNPLIGETASFGVTMHLRFTTPAMKFTVCCEGFDYSAAVKTINPVADEIVSSRVVRDAPKVQFRFGGLQAVDAANPSPDQLYTLLMVDQSETNSELGTREKPYLHWAVNNFQITNGGTLRGGETSLSYVAPSPASQQHRNYTILLYRQKARISGADLREYTNASSCPSSFRCLFDVNAFVSGEDMTLTSASWFRVKTDPYVVYSRTKAGLGSAAVNCRMLRNDLDIVGNNVVCPTKLQLVSYAMRVEANILVFVISLMMCLFHS